MKGKRFRSNCVQLDDFHALSGAAIGLLKEAPLIHKEEAQTFVELVCLENSEFSEFY